MIDAKVVQKAVDRLAMLRFFPSGAAKAVTILIGEMCASDEQVEWLARRVTQLYSEWPGPSELRAVLCSRYKPADGIEAYSEDSRYADGIPSEKPEQAALPAGTMKALPPGRMVSAAASVDAAICDLAKAKDMNRKEPAPRVRDIPVLPPGAKPITAEDIRRAEEEMRERRTREEIAS